MVDARPPLQNDHAAAPAATPPRTFRQRLLDALLTTDKAQRVRITHTLMACLIFAVCVALIGYAISRSMMNALYGGMLSACMLTTSLGFYAIFRSGLNLHLRDPELTVAQILTALTWVCAAYGITNEVHGGTLMLYALIMVFGMFNMSQRSAYFTSAYAILAMGGTMVFKSHTDPQHYPERIEWVYFVLVLFIIPTIAQLSTQISAMRDRLREQKKELVAQQAELEQAMKRIRELATHDELTGLINRREMSDIIGKYVELQKRESIGFSLAMIDLDHFKQINDTWGHHVGDEVLRVFGQQARAVLRETDIVARWGGEEFLVLLPDMADGQLNMGIDRLRQHLENLPVCAEAPELRVRFSAGLTQFIPGESIGEAIACADRALYQAKQSGRNRTVQVQLAECRNDANAGMQQPR